MHSELNLRQRTTSPSGRVYNARLDLFLCFVCSASNGCIFRAKYHSRRHILREKYNSPTSDDLLLLVPAPAIWRRSRLDRSRLTISQARLPLARAEARNWLAWGPLKARQRCADISARTVQRLRSDAFRRRLVRGISSQLRGGPLVRCTSASAMKQRTWTHDFKQTNPKSQTQGRREPRVALLLLPLSYVGDRSEYLRGTLSGAGPGSLALSVYSRAFGGAV